jgi:drug/metabolite transporter (DMT)-like permease
VAPLLKAKLLVIAGALLFSTGGVAIKLATLSAWQISCLRSLIAAVALLLVLPWLRTAWTWRSLVVAIPYATTFTLYTFANKLTTAANAIFLQDTAPLYILLLGPLLLRERIRSADLAFMAALIVGLGLIFAAHTEPAANATDPRLGNILAACSGFSWALTVMGLRWLAARSDGQPEKPISAIIAGCLLAGVFSAMFAFPFEGLSPGNWLIVVYLGVFQIALAYLLVTAGIRHISALEASLLLLVEPVLSPIWVWLLLTELPGRLALLGGAVVVMATVVYTRRSETVVANRA